jgi:hypothetical protein
MCQSSPTTITSVPQNQVHFFDPYIGRLISNISLLLIVAGADVNCTTVNGKVPVELLIVEDSRDEAVRKKGADVDVRPFLELLPKERVHPIYFVRTGKYQTLLTSFNLPALPDKPVFSTLNRQI